VEVWLALEQRHRLLGGEVCGPPVGAQYQRLESPLGLVVLIVVVVLVILFAVALARLVVALDIAVVVRTALAALVLRVVVVVVVRARVRRAGVLVRVAGVSSTLNITYPFRPQVHSASSSSTVAEATSLPFAVGRGGGACAGAGPAMPSRNPLSSFCMRISLAFSRSSVSFASKRAARLCGRSIHGPWPWKPASETPAAAPAIALSWLGERAGSWRSWLSWLSALVDQLWNAEGKPGSEGSSVEGGGKRPAAGSKAGACAAGTGAARRFGLGGGRLFVRGLERPMVEWRVGGGGRGVWV
jgi:hypothetical protein